MNNHQNQQAMFYLVKELKIAIASLLFSVFGSAMFFFETMVPLSKWFLLTGVLGIILVLFLIFKKSIGK
jgi:hypothetical protein